MTDSENFGKPGASKDEDPTVLYRIYDAVGALLYVGISLRLPARVGERRRSKCRRGPGPRPRGVFYTEIRRPRRQQPHGRREALPGHHAQDLSLADSTRQTRINTRQRPSSQRAAGGGPYPDPSQSPARQDPQYGRRQARRSDTPGGGASTMPPTTRQPQHDPDAGEDAPRGHGTHGRQQYCSHRFVHEMTKGTRPRPTPRSAPR